MQKRLGWLGLILCFAASAGAADGEIAVAPSGAKILGCGVESTTDLGKKKGKIEIRSLVVRGSTQLGIPFFDKSREGQIISIVARKGPGYGGVTMSALIEESAAPLPIRNGDEWMPAAPTGTFLSVRGNYHVFFLAENLDPAGEITITGQVARVHEQTLNMKCTTDAEVVQKWLTRAKEFNPW